MNDKFDELAKNMAQSVTRRQALRRFGAGIAGALLAALGLGNPTHALGQGTWTCSRGQEPAELIPPRETKPKTTGKL